MMCCATLSSVPSPTWAAKEGKDRSQTERLVVSCLDVKFLGVLGWAQGGGRCVFAAAGCRSGFEKPHLGGTGTETVQF